MTLQWNRDVKISSTSLRGYLEGHLWSFEETVARLVTLSGQPAESSDQYKTSVEFIGTFNGHSFTIYDYKEDRQLHIGGNEHLDVVGLQEVLLSELETVAPTPYTALEYYDERRGHTYPRGVSTQPDVTITFTAGEIKAVTEAIEFHLDNLEEHDVDLRSALGKVRS